jgi:hypothetical protein
VLIIPDLLKWKTDNSVLIGFELSLVQKILHPLPATRVGGLVRDCRFADTSDKQYITLLNPNEPPISSVFTVPNKKGRHKASLFFTE